MLVKIFACEKIWNANFKNKSFTASTTYIIPSSFPNLTVVILNNFLLHI